MKMQIKVNEKFQNRYIFYPYIEDEKIDFISKELLKKTEEENKLSSFTKGKAKRYFLEHSEINIVNIGKKENIREENIREFASVVVKKSKEYLYKSIDVFLSDKHLNLDKDNILQAFLEGLFLADYSFNKYKKIEKEFKLDEINIITEEKIENFNDILKKTKTVTDAVYLCRDLVNEPSNVCNIAFFEKMARNIAKENNLDINVFNHKELKKMGMNLILAVGQGASEPPRMIEISYNYSKNAKTAVLVGKGIIFDTGGINLKPSNSLDDMKGDMAGAATVLAVIQAVSRLKLPINVVSLMPLAENSIDSSSFKPGDIIVAYNKKSVEIKNCDAEGRLILADALSYADQKNPDIIIDIATLTGAAVIALGSKISAGFFKNREIKELITDIASKAGEPIWELPLFEDYKDMIKNEISDLQNIGEPPREAGTIIGALFLEEFVTNKNWVHLDIAGPSFIKNESFYLKKGATGVMVRTLINFLNKYHKFNKN